MNSYLPNLTSSDFDDIKFKYNESLYFEYKKSVSKENVKKSIETICAFLNRFGGYIIYGIKDDLELIGINNNSKEIDIFITSIDSIYHTSQIMGMYNENLETINPDSITITIYKNNLNLSFLVIKVIPIKYKYYQLLNGESFYRINASNLKKIHIKIYKDSEVLNMIEQAKQKINDEYTLIINNINHEKIIESNDIILQQKIQINRLIDEINNLNNNSSNYNNFFNCCFKFKF